MNLTADILFSAPERAKGGRPPGFQIDGGILKDSREAHGLDPEAAHKRALPEKMVEDESRARTWRRWEATGRIEDRATAECVARALSTTTLVLQGGPAPDRVTEIELQLRRQAEAGNADAQAAISSEAARGGSTHTVAERLATRIELAQFTRQLVRLNELGKVTGWDLRDLEQPANHHGYWLVASESAIGTSATQIVVGIDEAIWRVHQEVLGWLRPNGSEYATAVGADARLVFREEAPWFRVHLEHPTWPHVNRTLSLVRFEPGERGLKWTTPARFDRQQLAHVPFQFWSHANFIDGFAVGAPLQELRQLRLVIERVRTEHIEEAFAKGTPLPQPEIAAVVLGDLDELDDELLERFRAEGASHSLVLNWISQGLWPELRPRLQHWPRECWKLSAGEASIFIELDARPHVALRLGRKPLCRMMYRIKLVELQEDGSLRDQPWRNDNVAETMKRLDERVDELAAAPPLDRLFVGPPRPFGWPDFGDD
ncbi:hypothetical protein [Variovorax sp. dw_954]|uniref:hypothetical protein n=1 Tax=Variovorax sp. dw_954 TaxID=2720078 RepID=UPI001BD4496E|nr:hypothetical protein [Variovorax sp. dw_954]